MLTNGAFPLHGMARFRMVHFWGGVSTTSAEVSSDPYRYQNVTCKLYWSLIGQKKSSLLHHWTCDTRPNIDPLDLNQHSQRRIRRNFSLNKCTFLYQPKNSRFVVCWGSTDVPLVDNQGADPERAWWGDAERKSLMQRRSNGAGKAGNCLGPRILRGPLTADHLNNRKCHY